ncbi:MAG: hypothetical protein WCX46_00430 [Candidatus Paceibacterota bacterium]
MKKINSDYELIKKGIVVERKKRDRLKIISNETNFVLGKDLRNFISFNNLKSKKNKIETKSEVLNEYKNLVFKKCNEVLEEMKISEASFDQIIERIIQYDGAIDSWINFGYYRGRAICACAFGDNHRIYVNMYDPVAWAVGHNFIL